MPITIYCHKLQVKSLNLWATVCDHKVSYKVDSEGLKAWLQNVSFNSKVSLFFMGFKIPIHRFIKLSYFSLIS